MSKSKALAASPTARASSSLPLPFGASFFETQVDGLAALSAFIDGTPRIALADVNRLLGHEPNRGIAALRQACAASGGDLAAHVVQAAPNAGRRGRPKRVTFLDVEGVRLVCDAVPHGGADRLRKWLALAVATPRPHDATRDRRQDYALRLCALLVDHLSPEEVAALGRQLEAFTASVLSTRYSRDLNAATYNLYAEFYLRGTRGKRAHSAEAA